MWQKLVAFIKTNKIQMLKYGVVGLTSAVFDFGILILLTEILAFHYLYSATISFVIAALINYYLNRVWTFKSSGKKLKQLSIFFTVAIIGLLLNNFILWLGVETLDWHYVVAKVIATAIVTGSNFLGNKYLTFKQ